MADVREENIRVVGRFRPINKREQEEWRKQGSKKYAGRPEVPVRVERDKKTVTIENDTHRPYKFSFDEVLWWDTSQEYTFDRVATPVCRSALQGFNGTIFAYGQTGSGKTHTMIGPEQKFDVKESGIVPRAANFFFHAIENSPDIDTAELRVSFLEVYRGELRDLNPNPSKGILPLKIRQRLSGETYVENLNLTPVLGLSEMLKLIKISGSHRTMAATAMNKTSSRSHLIMTMYLRLKKTNDAGGHKLAAKVNFIDLAGSEKVKKTGAQGARMKEAQSINVGLSTLARVIESLVKRRRSIPFRDSMLTHILKDSLIGNTKTTVVVACSPHQFNLEETVTTCRFANRCKLIKTRVMSNKELTPSQMRSLIKKLKMENLKLKKRMNIQAALPANISSPQAHDPNVSNMDNLENEAKLGELEAENTKMQATTKMLEDERNALEKERDNLQEQVNDLNAKFVTQQDLEQTIQDLEIEVERLKKELADSEEDKRQLAIANALLASRLQDADDSDAKALVEKLQRQKQHLKGQRRELIDELKALRFNSDEAEKVYQTVYKEMETIVSALEDQNLEIDDLAAIRTDQDAELEDKNRQIQNLKQQLRSRPKRAAGGSNDDDAKSDEYAEDILGDGDDLDDEDYGDLDDAERGGTAGFADERTGPRGAGSGGITAGGVHESGFVISSDERGLIKEQEAYLLQVADKTTQEWQDNEERAWKQFLKEKAQQNNYKDGREMLKARRAEARSAFKAGKIDYMPNDGELMEDVREEFELRYDPATNTMHSKEEVDDNRAQYAMIEDDNDIDDPFEWDPADVSDWIRYMGLEKYCTRFERENIDGVTLLLDITAQSLKRDLGVKAVHVEKLMRGIKELRERSPQYEQYLIKQGIIEEVKAEPVLDANGIFEENVDYEDGDGEDKWELRDEEKQFGEQFWQLDDLFKILDIKEENKLDLAVFKHGLHALQVEMTDEEMDAVFREMKTDASGIDYKGFVQHFQFTDMLQQQQRQYAMAILAALPRVANNRRQYVARAAMVIKYAVQFNNSRNDINNYLYNKGLTKAEIDAAWKQFKFNPKSVGEISFRGVSMKKGKLIDMALKDESVITFDDYKLLKLLKRCGNRGHGGHSKSKDFTDLDYLRASGRNCKIGSMQFWFDEESSYFNGFQVEYICSNNENVTAPKNYVNIGQPITEVLELGNDEFITRVVVYFNHFICGIGIETNLTADRAVFGTETKKHEQLVAPEGSAIMAFYGSFGRLFESLGAYCIRLDNGIERIRTKSRRKKRGRSSRGIKSPGTPQDDDEGGSRMSTIRRSRGKKSEG